MCGIFGYVGDRTDAARIVLDGLKQLEYRGYDSWGIAVAREGRAAVERRVGKIGAATTTLPSSTSALGHTRWATQGGVTEANAHPHLDCTGRVALVHNGIVANDGELRQALVRRGHRLRSETDTELLAHLVEEALGAAGPGAEGLVQATMATFRALRGLNAIAVLDVRTGAIAAVKSGSPLVIGHAGPARLVASDASALLAHTRRVTFVRDGQAVLIDGAVRVFDAATGRDEDAAIAEVSWAAESADLGSHPDFMTKEILEQPALLARIAADPGPALALAASIEASTETFAIGCGSGHHAALAATHLFAPTRRRVTAATGSEFAHLLPHVGVGSLVLALSQSGETIDVLEPVRAAQAAGARVAAVTNVPGSSLTRIADQVVPIGAGPERCVLATKSLCGKLAVLVLAAHGVRRRTREGTALVRRAADVVAALLEGPRREAIRSIAEVIRDRDHLYVLGRGPSYPLALETALKIKEVSYIHAEGFAGGDLKHGVIALVEPGTPCVVLAPDDATLPDTIASAMQVRARGALVIGIGPRAHDAFDHHIEVADAAEANAIALAVPAQLLGYDLARLRGRDPDMPRNLAKSVTVK